MIREIIDFYRDSIWDIPTLFILSLKIPVMIARVNHTK